MFLARHVTGLLVLRTFCIAATYAAAMAVAARSGTAPAAAHQVVEGGGGGWGGWTGTGEPRTTGAGSHAHHKVVTPICLCPSALPSGDVPGLDGLHDTSYCLLRYVTVCFCTQVAFQVWMACGLLADSLAVAAQVRY